MAVALEPVNVLEPAKAKPLIRFAGGKTWAIPVLAEGFLRHLNATGGRYIEPFLGGGALALHLGIRDMILGDACHPVTEMYRCVQRSPGGVAWGLSAVAIEGVDEENYYHIRDLRPRTPLQRAARFLYLNRLSFNGVVRFNREGKFNVPYAKDKRRISMIERGGRDAITNLFPNKEKFMKVAAALAGAQLYCCDFQYLCQLAGEGDILYGDPPYDGTYNAYTPDGFGAEDHKRLAKEAKEAADAGAAVFVHNSCTDFVTDLYAWASVVHVKEKRQINSDVKGRHRVQCGIFTNRPDLINEEAAAHEA